MNISLSRIAVVAVFSLFAAASQADIDTYRVHGTVQQIDAANHKVTLAQDAVTELGWPMRTMTYKVDGDSILSGVAAGQSVDATFTAESPYNPSLHFITPTSR
jgi:Cu/Ag efflux protein CusF|nr:copper-binding protein [uncultured Tolumonas sp.]